MTNEETKKIPKQTKLVEEYLRLLEENKRLKKEIWDSWHRDITDNILYAVKPDDDVRVLTKTESELPIIEINGEHVVRFIRANESARGHRGNVLIYEDGVDKDVLDMVLIPMLEHTYSDHSKEYNHEPLLLRRKERTGHF
jgi:hypothetical protein